VSRAQAIAELSGLHGKYCPILDALLAATEETLDALLAEHQRIGDRICDLGPVAFGPRKGGRLVIMKPAKDEELGSVLLWLVGQRWLNEDHRIAVVVCAVRSHRLGKYLDGADTEGVTNFAARAREMYAAIAAKRGEPVKGDTKADRYREIADDLRCSYNTVKTAIQREARKDTLAFVESDLTIVAVPPSRPNLPTSFELRRHGMRCCSGNWVIVLKEARKLSGGDVGPWILQAPRTQPGFYCNTRE